MRIAKRDGITLEEINDMFKYGQIIKTTRADVTYKGRIVEIYPHVLVCECEAVDSLIDTVHLGTKRTLTVNKISFIGDKADSYFIS